MEVAVKNIEGKDTKKKVKLNDETFAIEPNDHAIYLDVKRYMASLRQGTHKAKERAEVNYSTKKIKKQKGTGGARAGSIKSPVFVGGGTVFGPRPRNYDIKVNKKVRKLARRSAFSYKAKEGNIIVLEKFAMEQPKTKEYAKILANLGLDGSKSLFIIGDEDTNLVLSSRNVQRTKVLTVNQLGTYEILHANKVVISEDAIEKLEASLN